MDTLEKDLQALAQQLTIRDRDGRPAILIGLIATFYFENGFTRPVRTAVSEVAEDYYQRFKDRLLWTMHPTSAHMHPITSNRVKHHTEWLLDHPDGESWSFGYHGGESEKAAASFQVSAFSMNKEHASPTGFFHIQLPIDYFALHGGTLPEFILPICKRLKPLSGVSGIGVIEPMDLLIRAYFHPAVRQLGERMPGLELESPVTNAHVLSGIKGVNWLTTLGDRWVQEMGGLDYLRIRLDEPNFPFYPYDGGLIIQAGQRPQLGDSTKNVWPRQYVTLAKVLKKIQIKTHLPMHFGTPRVTGKMDHEATIAWINRFDGK